MGQSIYQSPTLDAIFTTRTLLNTFWVSPLSGNPHIPINITSIGISPPSSATLAVAQNVELAAVAAGHCQLEGGQGSAVRGSVPTCSAGGNFEAHGGSEYVKNIHVITINNIYIYMYIIVLIDRLNYRFKL